MSKSQESYVEHMWRKDMGGQNDLMISPPMSGNSFCRGMKRIIDLAHGAGVYVFHHNDGNVRRIVP